MNTNDVLSIGGMIVFGAAFAAAMSVFVFTLVPQIPRIISLFMTREDLPRD